MTPVNTIAAGVGRDGVGVGEPEVERDDRGLDEEAGRDQRERRHNEFVAGLLRERLADLGEIQRAGAAVEQRDAEQDHHRADAVGHREGQRALQRGGALDPVRRERVRGHAHQLEEHEHVEQVAGQREAGQRAEEDEDQRVEGRPDGVEEAPREHERRAHEHSGEQGQRRAERVEGEVDADDDAVLPWLPAADPRHHGAVAVERLAQEEQAQDGDEERAAGGDQLRMAALEREQAALAASSAASRNGTATVSGARSARLSREEGRAHRGRACPRCFSICTAIASSSAVTAPPTTTSVSVSACTTGSTAGVSRGMSMKTGATESLR